MKIRADIIRMYREIHSWVGIVCGLFLFVAFYAGAITMFERPLQDWASPPVSLPPPVALERVPELLEKTFAEHPEARKSYTVVLHPTPSQPATLVWGVPQRMHGPSVANYSALAEDGSLVTIKESPSEAAHFINMLHQQVGLWMPHEAGRLFMGIVALLYAVALISGTLVVLPGLIKNLFAIRLGQNAKRMWLDLHSMLGLFSLPFHIIMALTSVVFAFHDEIYVAEHALLGRSTVQQQMHGHSPSDQTERQREQRISGDLRVPLEPAQIVVAIAKQAPGFSPETLIYDRSHGGHLALRVTGSDPRYGARGASGGFAGVDPYSGKLLSTDYLPGHQTFPMAVLTSFFVLHFGSFGGEGVRWGYAVLGLAGAFMFYAGNQLWIVSRRRRERGSGRVEDTRATRVLCSLTIGCSLGCVAGVSAVLAVAPLHSAVGKMLPVQIVYFATFLSCVVVCFCIRERLAIRLLLVASAVLTFLMPVSAAFVTPLSHATTSSLIVDGVALLYGAFLMVWAVRPQAGQPLFRKEGVSGLNRA
ncbi:PepSY-associated TM helix domain-containing protein [Gluconobacter frateurii NBRC 101659]|uniref:PepSY-associated TM helix domain-containing protein n=1 Tax=Gluconobacter japonicus TaxID=376620 RepID=UPI000299DC79|nr:PepSY-associated TM helix domain-containing protein [Gluconobacter frateurii NBRC 101659]